ncbi:MAG: ATP-binding protein [Lentisphaerae bacterium]|nr:ATP-binding protein [Lentisphaerota bacterium]
MNKFVNREAELRALKADYARAGSSLFILYGRRRLGKTTLLRQFADCGPAVYHMADRSAESDARRLLAGSMAVGLREPTLQSSEYGDWYALLAAYDRVRPGGKPILILDEYQYLCEQQPAFSSMIQRWWDEHWRHSPIMLVLSGSVLSMMYRETLARSSPLFGRRTGQCLLSPMRFKHVQEFFPKLPARARLEMWSLTGGVPRYAELAAGYQGFAEAVRGLVLTKDGPLYAEARFLLQDEVTTSNVYWSLLHTIGSGVARISEVAARMGLAANQLTRYLSALRDLGLVHRVVPVTERLPEKSKKGIYQVTDPFLRLWFGCVAPVESLVEFGRIGDVESLIAGRLAAQIAWAFEEVCRQHVEDIAAQYGAVKVGRFWDRTMEIDVAAVNEKGDVVLAGECKWTSKPVGKDVIQALQGKVAKAWPERHRAVGLMVCSSGGFTADARRLAAQAGMVLIGCEEVAGST